MARPLVRFITASILLLSALAPAALAQANPDWIERLREQRQAVIDEIELGNGAFFIELKWEGAGAMAIPVSRERVTAAMRLNPIIEPGFSAERAMRTILAFDRAYRQALRDKLAEIERELSEATAKPPTPPPPSEQLPSPVLGRYPGLRNCACGSSDGRNRACANNGCAEPENFSGVCIWSCWDANGDLVRIRARDGALVDAYGRPIAR